jgi:hypothetical protein
MTHNKNTSNTHKVEQNDGAEKDHENEKFTGIYGSQTGTNSKAYLSYAWSNRESLSELERKGFAQFFYLALCSHLEALLCSMIKARMSSITSIETHFFERQIGTVNGIKHEYSFDPVIKSVLLLSRRIAKDAETAAIPKLIEIFDRVFPVKLESILGSELSQDFKQLINLRNIFGHGRSVTAEFELKDGEVYNARLDGSELKAPAQRLIKVGIVVPPKKGNQAHIEWVNLVYKDEALIHFYKAVLEVEKKLRSSIDYLPEEVRVFVTPLPDISI